MSSGTADRIELGRPNRHSRLGVHGQFDLVAACLGLPRERDRLARRERRIADTSLPLAGQIDDSVARDQRLRRNDGGEKAETLEARDLGRERRFDEGLRPTAVAGGHGGSGRATGSAELATDPSTAMNAAFVAARSPGVTVPGIVGIVAARGMTSPGG